MRMVSCQINNTSTQTIIVIWLINIIVGEFMKVLLHKLPEWTFVDLQLSEVTRLWVI